MNTQKNYTLAIFKLIAAYMVVFIHVKFYGKIGDTIDALARFAVPLFFIVSGFYSYQSSLLKIKKRILNTLRLIIFSSLIYTLFNIIMIMIKDTEETVFQYFKNYLSIGTLIKIFVFNMPVSSIHLWYLSALLYVYILYYLFTKLSIKENLLFVCSFVLLSLNLVLGEGLSVFGITVPALLVRNFLFVGIPFFGIGLFIRKHEKEYKTIPDYMSLICLIVGVIETLLSRSISGKNELYLGSLLILFAIVVTYIKYSRWKYPSLLVALSDCSTNIYIFHMMVASIVTELCLWVNIDPQTVTLKMIRPVLVCLISTLIAFIINTIKSKYQCRKHKNM